MPLLFFIIIIITCVTCCLLGRVLLEGVCLAVSSVRVSISFTGCVVVIALGLCLLLLSLICFVHIMDFVIVRDTAVCHFCHILV